MNNYFQGSKESPYHISIGAVLRNAEGKIATHYFEHFIHPGFGEAHDFHILMRETIEPGESLETVLSRGLMEEFGATATLHSYIGSIVSHFPKEEITIEKTTLYFLCDLISIDPSLRSTEDAENASEIQWSKPSYLIDKMKEQGSRIGREDIDESKILQALR